MDSKNMKDLNLDEMDKVSGGSSSDDSKKRLNIALIKAGPCLCCGKAIRIGDGVHIYSSYVGGKWHLTCGYVSFTIDENGTMRLE